VKSAHLNDQDSCQAVKPVNAAAGPLAAPDATKVVRISHLVRRLSQDVDLAVAAYMTYNDLTNAPTDPGIILTNHYACMFYGARNWAPTCSKGASKYRLAVLVQLI
jgi:hypothetical protein